MSDFLTSRHSRRDVFRATAAIALASAVAGACAHEDTGGTATASISGR